MKTMNFNPKITLRPGGLVFLGIMPVKNHKNQNFHQIKTRKMPKNNQTADPKIGREWVFLQDFSLILDLNHTK